MEKIRKIIRQIIKEQQELNDSLQYESDDIRYNEIKKALEQYNNENFVEDDEVYTKEDLLETQWLTIVLPKKNYLDYYELYTQECWDALYQKPEYKGLKKPVAIIKFIKERFSKIASKAGLKVKGWSFKNDVLNIKLAHS